MPDRKFRIKLHNIHKGSGLSVYRVAKLTGMNANTVNKYIGNGDIISGRLESAVLQLAAFYGVDWRDPAIVDVIEVNNEA